MNKILYTPEDSTSRLAELAKEIIKAYPTTPVFVALLRGAAPFASKLMFEITRQNPNYHPELDYMTVSTYGQDHTAKQPQIVTDISPSTDVTNRKVIILDDTLDTGVTARFVQEHLHRKGARSVTIAVLVNKLGVRTDGFEPEYAAFVAGPEWLTGMGLDDPHVAPEANRWSETISVVD